MADPAELLWSALNVLTRERYQALLEIYGTLEAASRHIGEELLRGLGCRPETVTAALVRLEEFDADRTAAFLDKSGIRFLELNDPHYPRLLREIADAPPFLYCRGDLSVLDQPCIGLVGTRTMTAYGRRVTGLFIPEFVSAGLVTVSGLADGIDTQVAEETLLARGRTVAVLGHGMLRIGSAKKEKLAERIVAGGGLVCTEFPLDKEPEKYTYPARNRIIAGLSLGTVVLEAPEESGALITADLALDYAREVFAVPGQVFDPNYAGCHALIRKGAHLARHPGDVLREIGIVAPEQNGDSAFSSESEEEARVHRLLTTMPQDMDVLAEKSGMDAGALNAALTMLELAGGAKNVGGGQWVRR